MAEIPKWATKSADGVVLKLYVQPNASRSETIGEHGSGSDARLKIRIAAPPVDSAANEELIYFLKKALGVPASRVEIIRGSASRAKDVLIQGVTPDEVSEKLGPSAKG